MANIARPHPLISNSLRCPSCIFRSQGGSRRFTTCSNRQKYGPESPKYIDVPQPLQKTAPVPARVKGVLPVPRDVFKYRQGGHEAANLTEQPDAARKLTGKGTTDAERSRNDWRQRMTDVRKANYREGLTELASRKRTTLAKSAARSKRTQTERQRLLAMPEREDERLTNPTTAMVMKTQFGGGMIPDPNREQRVAEMQANVAAKEAQRAGDRQDALHTLYMHARDFITTETQLDKEIDAVFGTPEAPVTFARGNSIWSQNEPESIQDKLNRANRSSDTMKDTNWVNDLLKKRTKTIAEKLTGGKI